MASGNPLSKIGINAFAAPAEIEVLSLSDCAFRILGPMGNLTSLRVLNMDGNQIETIDELALHPLVNIVELRLDDNYIHDVTAIRDIPTLEDVFLRWNRISYISDDAFSGLPSLKTLDLRSNRISLYSAQLAVHVSLLLGDNELTSFDAQSLNLTTLQLLNADDNKHLQNMSLIETPSVRSLYAAYCNLHDIVIISQGGYSEELASQHPLEYMHLNDNKFRDLSRFHDLPQLRALKLSNNVISEIGETVLLDFQI